MPNDAIPTWFDADHYAQQKVNQMNATSYEMGANGWFTQNNGGAAAWTTDLFNTYLAQYTTTGPVVVGGLNLATGAHVDAYQNFVACNAANYSGVSLGAINVSPNPLFDVAIYLQNLANYNNANPDAYSKPAPEGGWTMQNELNEIFSYKASVWDHYNANWDTLQLDPSNGFDTSAYLQLRADAMGPGTTVADAIAAIKATGNNPIQDFYEWGKANGIENAPAVVAGEQTTPGIANWNPWSDSTTVPTETDPYEQNVTTVEIMPGEFNYKGEDGQNTRFEAKWVRTNADNTLSAKDVINGGTGYNTLAVELGRDWDGFDGVRTEANQFQPQPDPSVTNVGRIVLNHSEITSERSWTFDAKNISDDTVRYDLNATGTGVISLSNLGAKVARVNISDVLSPNVNGTNPDTTQLSFQPGLNSGTNDSLTIGVSNVCADGKGSAPIQAMGIENVTVDAMAGDNTINLAQMSGVKNLTVTGSGNLTISNSAAGIKAYDASAATGNVNFGVTGLTNATVTGGQGTDTVTFASGSTVSKANWTSIESVAFQAGSSSLNAKGVEGLQTAWVGSNGTSTITNLTADNFTVYQTASSVKDAQATVKVDGVKGSLDNIAWISHGDATDGTAFKTNFSSNAAGDATIIFTGEDTLADGSVFNFSKMTGKITINDPSATAGTLSTGTKLVAPDATALDITLDGNFLTTADSDLDSVQQINLNLTNATSDSTTVDTAIFQNSFKGAQTVTINGGDESVQLGQLGNTTDGTGVDLTVQNVTSFKAGAIEADLGGDINININASGAVALGNITTETNESSNNQGDVTLMVNAAKWGAATLTDANPTTATPAAVTIEGGQLNINLSGVDDAIGTSLSDGLTLKSAESIYYTGSDESDFITVSQVGKGSYSSFNLGGGADSIKIDTASTLAKTGLATINVDLGTGEGVTETVDVTAAAQGFLQVNIAGYETGDSIGLHGTKAADAAAANAILAKCGLSAMVPTDGTGLTEGVYQSGDTAYAIMGTVTDGVATMGTVVIIQDVAEGAITIGS